MGGWLNQYQYDGPQQQWPQPSSQPQQGGWSSQPLPGSGQPEPRLGRYFSQPRPPQGVYNGGTGGPTSSGGVAPIPQGPQGSGGPQVNVSPQQMYPSGDSYGRYGGPSNYYGGKGGPQGGGKGGGGWGSGSGSYGNSYGGGYGQPGAAGPSSGGDVVSVSPTQMNPSAPQILVDGSNGNSQWGNPIKRDSMGRPLSAPGSQVWQGYGSNGPPGWDTQRNGPWATPWQGGESYGRYK